MTPEEPRPNPAPSPVAAEPSGPTTTADRSGLLPTLAIVGVCLALAGLTWAFLIPPPALDERRFESLAKEGRFVDAEKLLRSQLGSRPNDPRAHLLLAQLQIERPDLQGDALRDSAEQALVHLGNAEGGANVEPALVELLRGKALYLLDRWDQAEEAWNEAIRIEPTVPEAGFRLLGLYYRELRRCETSELALKLFEVEPDPGDRARLLLESMHSDAIRPDPISLVPLFEKAVEADPKGIQCRVALGRSLVLSSELAKGVATLRETIEEFPESLTAWDGYLDGLDRAGRSTEIGDALTRLPESLVGLPRLARHVGLAAENRGDLPGAITAYQASLAYDPADFETAVRLERVLRLQGQTDEADRWRDRIAEYRQAQKDLLPLYDQAEQAAGAGGTLGVEPHPDLVKRIADSRERMWHPAEADAWRRLEAGTSTP